MNLDGSSEADDFASKALAKVDEVAPKGWRLKLAKACAQLLVGTRAGAAVYAGAREHLDEIEGRSAMNKQLYSIAAQQIVNDPEMVERAKARLVGGMLKKQENLEAVISGATDRMLALPAPERLESGPKSQQAIDEETSTASDEPLNSDWAEAFSEVAENATSEELRDRLSRMLIGEISNSGTFPRATIRAISELEKSDLECLVEMLPFTHGSAILKDEPLSKSKLDRLNECGLVDYNPVLAMTSTWNATPESPGALAGREWALVMEVTKEKSLNFPIVPLTRVGKSVVSLLDQFDEEAALRAFVDRMDKTDVKKIILGKYDSLPNDQIRINNGVSVFPKPVVFDIGLR